MKDKEILQKAIEKAIKNGYKPHGLLGAVLRGDIGVGMDPNVYNHLAGMENECYPYIFSHSFAEAFWGEEKMGCYSSGCHHYCDCVDEGLPKWMHYIQQMVVEEQPIQYLKQFLDD